MNLALSHLPLTLAQAPGPPSMTDMALNFAPFVLIFVIFYFLLIRPARQRQKALQQMIEGLKRGDKVVTSGGLYGEVAAIDGAVILLKIADNVKVRVARSAISGLEQGAEQTEKGGVK
jgi:preprotein translocase subunit YajC